MPNTKLTKQRLINHFQYSKWPYILVIALSVMVADLLFTTTQYRAPNARRVDIELVSAYANIEAGVEAERIALEAGQAYELARDEAAGIDVSSEEYEIPLQEVHFYSLGYDPNGDDESAYYGSQKFMVTLAAQEGDIFILTRPLMEDLQSQGVLVDLTPFIESGILDPGDRDLSRVTYPEYVEEGEAPSGRECIYALQATSLTKLWDTMTFDPVDKYMVIMSYSQNQDTAAAVMQSLIDQMEPTPEETAQ